MRHDIQQPLFGAGPAIVTAPKPHDTRGQAKAKVNTRSLRLAILKSLYEGEWNADKWAEFHDVYFMNVRPRFSELNKKGMLHRTRIGLSNQGNAQDVFTLYPYIRNRMQLLCCKVGVDAAAAEILSKYGL